MGNHKKPPSHQSKPPTREQLFWPGAAVGLNRPSYLVQGLVWARQKQSHLPEKGEHDRNRKDNPPPRPHLHGNTWDCLTKSNHQPQRGRIPSAGFGAGGRPKAPPPTVASAGSGASCPAHPGARAGTRRLGAVDSKSLGG